MKKIKQFFGIGVIVLVTLGLVGSVNADIGTVEIKSEMIYGWIIYYNDIKEADGWITWNITVEGDLPINLYVVREMVYSYAHWHHPSDQLWIAPADIYYQVKDISQHQGSFQIPWKDWGREDWALVAYNLNLKTVRVTYEVSATPQPSIPGISVIPTILGLVVLSILLKRRKQRSR